MVLLLVIIIILFLPIFLSVYLYYEGLDKRLYFAIYLFSFIKILDGYIKIRKLGGFYIHVTEEKAIILDYKSILNFEKGSFNIQSALSLVNFNLITDIGIKSFNTITIFLFFKTLTNILGKVFTCTKPYFELKNNLNIIDVNENLINIKCSFTLYFNIFCILLKLIANVIKRGTKYVKKHT